MMPATWGPVPVMCAAARLSSTSDDESRGAWWECKLGGNHFEAKCDSGCLAVGHPTQPATDPHLPTCAVLGCQHQGAARGLAVARPQLVLRCHPGRQSVGCGWFIRE